MSRTIRPACSALTVRLKLGGELAVKEQLDNYFIVRISWVFGKNGNNFVKTMLRLCGDARNVVSHQIGSPTYTADLAPLLGDMIVTEKYGTYHATNEGICSWADFAEAIFRTGWQECQGESYSDQRVPDPCGASAQFAHEQG